MFLKVLEMESAKQLSPQVDLNHRCVEDSRTSQTISRICLFSLGLHTKQMFRNEAVWIANEAAVQVEIEAHLTSWVGLIFLY